MKKKQSLLIDSLLLAALERCPAYLEGSAALDELNAHMADIEAVRRDWCDWRNYLDDVVCSQWDELPLEAKLVAYLQATATASMMDTY